MRLHQTLLYAIMNHEFGTIDKLIDHGLDLNAYEMSPLIDAMDYNAPDMLEYLLARGADPNHQTEDGLSPLFYVFDSENPLIFARILLSRGADPNLQDRDGDTVLMKIIRDHQFRRDLSGTVADVVLLLLRHGADLDEIQNNDGDTVRRLARSHPSVLSRSIAPRE
jgi:ankyrin repeat protein